MATNINEINRRFRQTVSDINQGQAKSTVNYNMIENLANKADNVLLKSVESSMKNVDRNPNLATVDAEIKKLATIKDSTIFQETDNYINTSIEDLKVTKNYIQNRNTTLDNIRNSVKSFSAKDRDDVTAYTNITDMIFKAELDGYLNTNQRQIELASLKQRRTMLDDEADALLLNDALIKMASATTPKEVASIAGKYMTEAKDDTGFQRLMSFSDKLNRAANSVNTESMKNVAKNKADRMSQFLNDLNPMYTSMVKADQNYDTKVGTNNSLQLIIGDQPAFSDYGSQAPANVHNWNIDGLANNLAKDLVAMSEIENFTDKDTENIKAYASEHKNSLENIFDPNHRMHMKTYVNMLMSSQDPNYSKKNDADVTELNSITSRYEILKQIYNMGPQAYPDKFLVDGEPVFGDGNPRTERSFNMDLYSTSAESTSVDSTQLEMQNTDLSSEEPGWSTRPLPADTETNPISPFLKLDSRYNEPPKVSVPVPKVPDEDIAANVNIDMTGLELDEFDEFTAPESTIYPGQEYVPKTNYQSSLDRYILQEMTDDLSDIQELRQVLQESQNKSDSSFTIRRYSKGVASKLAEKEQSFRDKMGKYINPLSGRIMFEGRPVSYGEGFTEIGINQLLKSLSTVEKK